MSNGKKINIVFPYNTVGGAFRSTYEISNRLTKKGFDVVIYFPFFPLMEGLKIFSIEGLLHFFKGIARSLIRRNNISWFDCKFKIYQIPSINRHFIRDADVIIANHWPVAEPVFNLPKTKGEKYYFIRDVEQWASYYPLEVAAFNLNMKRLVVAHWIKDYLDNEFNLEVERVVTNGFNFEKFAVQKKEYSVTNPIISVIYSSHPMKAMNDAIKVLKEIKEKHPSTKIIFFGFGSKPKNISFEFEYIKGAKGEQVREIYAKSDIFFCPSIQEGFHNPPSEAMAAKCAVVATSVGSVPETIIHMENGLTMQPGDTAMMVDCIDKLLRDYELRVELSESAHRSIQNLTWDRSIDILEELFRGE